MKLRPIFDVVATSVINLAPTGTAVKLYVGCYDAVTKSQRCVPAGLLHDTIGTFFCLPVDCPQKTRLDVASTLSIARSPIVVQKWCQYF